MSVQWFGFFPRSAAPGGNKSNFMMVTDHRSVKSESSIYVVLQSLIRRFAFLSLSVASERDQHQAPPPPSHQDKQSSVTVKPLNVLRGQTLSPSATTSPPVSQIFLEWKTSLASDLTLCLSGPKVYSGRDSPSRSLTLGPFWKLTLLLNFSDGMNWPQIGACSVCSPLCKCVGK